MTTVDPDARPPLVLVGMPRSGTSWTMAAIATDSSLYRVQEPDNETRTPSAIWAKHRTGRFPVLAPGEEDQEYRSLWLWIMAGAYQTRRLRVAKELLRRVRAGGRRRFHQGRFSPLMQAAGTLAARPNARPAPALASHRLFVKTVMAPLSIEWLASEFPVEVLVLLRHPGNVLASWTSMDLSLEFARLDDRPAIRRRIDSGELPRPGSGDFERLAWQVGLLSLGLEEAAARNPGWVVRTHEDLCIEPSRKFRDLFEDLGLNWNPQVEEFLEVNDRPGEGFRTQRTASDQPGAWKVRLNSEQIATMQRVLAEFPLTTWAADDLIP